MTTFASLFTGGGGADIGARQAGLTPVWGVEYVSEIAAIAERNLGHPVTVADILQLDPLDFEPVDVLHASPPCPNFSVAKAGAEETEHDIALGRKVAEFVEALCPSLFTLENVYGYRKAKSFRLIVKALRRLGYHVRWWHLNSADYGVAQTRRRLILVAAQDFAPRRPEATHRDPATVVDGQLSLFGDALPPWVGWYAAIEDLIPTLPDSAFAPWQLARLPAGLKETFSIGADEGTTINQRLAHEPANSVTLQTGAKSRAMLVGGQWAGHLPIADEEAPADTVVATLHSKAAMPRAFIVSNAATEWSDGIFDGAEPALAVSLQTGGRARAFIVKDGDMWAPVNGGAGDSATVSATNGYRAFIVDGKLNDNSTSLTTRDGDARSVTVTTSHNNRDVKAFVAASNSNADSWGDNYRDGELPQFTVTERDNGRSRAFAYGRVVQMTPRALARFQSIPDWYELPESKTLACRIIGNACPPLLMQRVLEAQR